MPDVTANYEMLLDFIAFLAIFLHYRDRRSLKYEVFYLHQTFTDDVSTLNTHILIC